MMAKINKKTATGSVIGAENRTEPMNQPGCIPLKKVNGISVNNQVSPLVAKFGDWGGS
ncbi:MAG: hypothetical protein SAQ54_08725 [Oscillatoria sp. PMC 1050.18]|nr:hypothetical protein [Oscillatoria sp. PMC 1050.18]